MEQFFSELAGLILNCKPDDLKGITQRADGSLAVIAPNGMKFIFSPVELENARESFGLPPIQADNSRAEPIVGSRAEPVEAAFNKPLQPKRIKPMGQQVSGKTNRMGSRL